MLGSLAIYIALLIHRLLVFGVIAEPYAPDDLTILPETSDVVDRCLLQVSDRQHHASKLQRRKAKEVMERDSSKQVQHLERSLLSKSRSRLDKIQVEVFYQFQCPHCVEFLTKELRQVWEDVEIGPFIEVGLYPEDFPMECCREGDEECMGSHKGLNSCLGSRVELCTADILKNSTKHVPFVLCMASHGHRADVEITSQECAQKHGISMDEIRACVNSRRGFDLMIAVGEKSANVNSDFIPWVMVNGKHAENNALLPAVCRELEKGLWLWEKRPSACSAVAELQSGGEKNGCDKKHPCFFVDPGNSSRPAPF